MDILGLGRLTVPLMNEVDKGAPTTHWETECTGCSEPTLSPIDH